MVSEELILAWLAWFISLTVWIAGFWISNRERNAAMLVSMAALFLSMIVRPPIILLGLDYPIPPGWFDGYEYYTVAQGSLFAAAWIFLLVLFYQLAAGIGMPQSGLLPKVRRDLPIAPLIIVTTAIVALAALITVVLVIASGGISSFQVAVKLDKSLTGAYVLRQLSTIGIILSLLLIVHFAQKEHVEKNVRANRAGLYYGFALLLVGLANNYAWANRYYIAIALLGLGLIWHLNIRRISFLRSIFLLGGVIAALQGLRTIRFALFSDVVGRDINPNFSFWREISLSMHFAEFDAMLLAIRDVGERFDFRAGKDFVNGLLSWIPRFLYPSKESFHIGEWLRQVYDPTKVNGWPPSLPGAWYVNFGLSGILLGTLISGVVLAVFDAHYRNRRSPWDATMGVMLPLLMTGGGVSMGFPQQIVLTLFPVWMISVGLRTVRPRIRIGRRTVL